jgi:hypothetical protein
MEATLNIPAREVKPKVTQFRFTPGVTEVTVAISIPSEDKRKFESVDIQPLLALIPNDKKATIKQFFKRVGALALDQAYESFGVDVEESDITDDIFE